jgi:hypothetical protein
MLCALSQRANQKPSRPASKATTMRSILCPAFSASSRHRCNCFGNALSSTASFFNGWRSTPGKMPPTSQFDRLISMTAISVPSGSRAVRDRLRPPLESPPVDPPLPLKIRRLRPIQTEQMSAIILKPFEYAHRLFWQLAVDTVCHQFGVAEDGVEWRGHHEDPTFAEDIIRSREDIKTDRVTSKTLASKNSTYLEIDGCLLRGHRKTAA